MQNNALLGFYEGKKKKEFRIKDKYGFDYAHVIERIQRKRGHKEDSKREDRRGGHTAPEADPEAPPLAKRIVDYRTDEERIEKTREFLANYIEGVFERDRPAEEIHGHPTYMKHMYRVIGKLELAQIAKMDFLSNFGVSHDAV